MRTNVQEIRETRLNRELIDRLVGVESPELVSVEVGLVVVHDYRGKEKRGVKKKGT